MKKKEERKIKKKIRKEKKEKTIKMLYGSF
jgi:hypothetical protein